MEIYLHIQKLVYLKYFNTKDYTYIVAINSESPKFFKHQLEFDYSLDSTWLELKNDTTIRLSTGGRMNNYFILYSHTNLIPGRKTSLEGVPIYIENLDSTTNSVIFH